MAFYRDSQMFCEVMVDLFERTMAQPDAVDAIKASGLVLRLITTDPPAVLVVDGRSTPPGFSCGSTAARADLVLRMPADVLHQVWLGQIRLRDAFFQGQIRIEGPLLRALTLADLFRQVEAIYPSVLQARGMLGGPPS